MYITTDQGIKIHYEAFGSNHNPPLLLLMGNSAQGALWPDDFCQTLAELNFYVIRFDYRDTGLSSCLDYEKNPYDLFNLADDVIALLDANDINKAHLVGLSMGGVIAAILSAQYPDRVSSLTIMMSSSNLAVKNDAFAGKDTTHFDLPPPKKEFVEAVIAINKNAPTNREEKIAQIVANWRLANGASPRAIFDQDYWYKLIDFTMQREAANPEAKNLKFANHGNHSKAQNANRELEQVFKAIIKPTLIIHGEEDPIFPKEHAVATHGLIKNSQLLLVKDMGHALNPRFFESIIQAIVKHTLDNGFLLK